MPLPKRKTKAKEAPKAERRVDWHAIGTILACVLLLALFIAMAAFVNTAIGYAPAIALVLLLAISGIYLAVLSRYLQFEVEGFSCECVRGNEVAFRLKAANTAFIPAIRVGVKFYMSDLFGGEGASSYQFVTLPPRSSKTFDFNLRFDHLGEYQVGVDSVEVHDLLGVFKKQVMEKQLEDVRVIPDISAIEKFALSQDSQVEAASPLSAILNDGMEYSNVREYVWGDPIKAIHWKLSARYENYYTRLYELMTNPGVCISIDFESDETNVSRLMGLYDTLVESALSLERFAAEHNMNTELVFRGEEGNARIAGPISEDSLSLLMGRLPKIATGDGLQALELYTKESTSPKAQSNQIIVTNHIDENLIEAVYSVRARKLTPAVLAVVAPDETEEGLAEAIKILRQLGANGVQYAILETAEDLIEGGRHYGI